MPEASSSAVFVRDIESTLPANFGRFRRARLRQMLAANSDHSIRSGLVANCTNSTLALHTPLRGNANFERLHVYARAGFGASKENFDTLKMGADKRSN